MCRKCRSQIQKLVLCWGVGAIVTGVKDSEGSPMVDVEVVEWKMRGGEEKIERVLMAAEAQESNESGYNGEH